MKKNLLVLSILTIVFLGCSKSDDNPINPACTITKENIAGSYKITAISYKAPGLPSPVDGMLLLDDCEKDDIYVLNVNGTLNYNDAGVSCSPPGSYSGTWSLNGNEITIDGQAFTIASFDCQKLVGKGTNLQTPGDEGTVTFTKQ